MLQDSFIVYWKIREMRNILGIYFFSYFVYLRTIVIFIVIYRLHGESQIFLNFTRHARVLTRLCANYIAFLQIALINCVFPSDRSQCIYSQRRKTQSRSLCTEFLRFSVSFATHKGFWFSLQTAATVAYKRTERGSCTPVPLTSSQSLKLI